MGQDFLSSIDNTFKILGDTISILIKYPTLLVPMFISWIIYASLVIYFYYYFNWESVQSLSAGLWIFFLIIFVCCFIFSFSALVVLEIIQQIETGSKLSFFKALDEVLRKDLLKAFPIMLVWAIIWFILEVLEMILRKDKNSTRENSYENMAKTLSGYESFSIAGLTFDLIKSGVRLIVFFIYPAIAWEDLSTMRAVKKGFKSIKNNVSEFIIGFLSIEAIAVFIFLPAGIMFFLTDEVGIVFSDTTWMLVILYIGIATSLYLFLQQIFAALLYMWNMKWEREALKAVKNNMPLPKLSEVKKPDLLDNIPDLMQ